MRLGVAVGGIVGTGRGLRVGETVGGRVGVRGGTALGEAVGCSGVRLGETVGWSGVGLGVAWTGVPPSPSVDPLRAIAVPATATTTTAAAAIPPSTSRVTRRFGPASLIVALRNLLVFGRAEGREPPPKGSAQRVGATVGVESDGVGAVGGRTGEFVGSLDGGAVGGVAVGDGLIRVGYVGLAVGGIVGVAVGGLLGVAVG
ncbi:hypothetical protein ACQPYH_02240 [Kribbella sp. CA-245084]|uniref:hypothetical protein n=1 Tax=Kribbella sp. CA-245084 TaxID=3239940 RepID=UPI003D9268B4